MTGFPAHVLIFDVSSLHLVDLGDGQLGVYTGDGRWLAAGEGNADSQEDVYRLLSQARTQGTVTAVDDAGRPAAAEVGFYIPKVGMITTRAGCYDCGRMLLPVAGLPASYTPDGLRAGRSVFPAVEVDQRRTSSAFAVYAA